MRLLEVDGSMELVPDQGQIADFVAGLDILAAPSWKDVAAAGVLDAMTLGIPVVCFRDNLAVSQTLGETGVTVDGYDVHEMARAIHQLVQDPDKLACLGMKERTRVQDCFLDTDAPDLLLEAIESLVVPA
jgi:glycosyltransferase involved in cell wall biosynthesis